MDALTECRFLLNLVAYAKTLVGGYLVPPGASRPALTVRGIATVTTTYTVTDQAYIRLLFKRIYNEPFPEPFPEPGATGIDERVADLITAFDAVPRG